MAMGDAAFARRPIINTESPEAKLDEAVESSQTYLDTVGITDAEIRLHYDGERAVEKYHATPTYEVKDVGKKFSIIQEAITHYGIDKADWFGKDFHALKRSNYDDLTHGYDLVAAVRGTNVDGEPVLKTKLGIDLTTGSEDFEKKFEDISYKVDRYPGSMLYQFCVDPESSTYGAQQIPQIALQYSQEDIEELMPAWKHRNVTSEGLTRSPIPMRLMTQALLQAAHFGKRIEDGRADRIRGDYRISAQYLKEALSKEMWRQKKLPRRTVEETVEMIADLSGTHPDVVRSNVLPQEKKNTRPILGQLLWG